MALRFGVSAVVVAALIGITVLVTNNKDDNRAQRHHDHVVGRDDHPDDGCACRPSRGLRRDRPAREPEPADVQIRPRP